MRLHHPNHSRRLLIRSWALAALTEDEHAELEAQATALGVRGGCLSERGPGGPWQAAVYGQTLRAEGAGATVVGAFERAFAAYREQLFTPDELAAIQRQGEAVA